MRYLNYFLRKHWFWGLLLLFLLWSLPKILNAYAVVLEGAKGVIDSVGGILRIPGEYIERGKALVGSLQATIAKSPPLLFAVPLLISKSLPGVSFFLAAWQLVDFFKPEEEVILRRTVNNATTAAPPPPEILPQNDFSNFFAP